MVITAGIQALQAITPRLFTKRREKNRVNIYQKQALKKSNKTQNIMVAVFVFMALVLSAGLQVYWFFTGLFTIGQNVVNHYIIKNQSKKKKRKVGY
jgi:YidC/Oxa1 family membrane protein insertase